MKETENQHFGGGNTHWEEMKLGKFATRYLLLCKLLEIVKTFSKIIKHGFSETRLVEILEFTCKKDNLGGAAKLLDLDRNAEYKVEKSHRIRQSFQIFNLTWICEQIDDTEVH